jgi:hypothetical protein
MYLILSCCCYKSCKDSGFSRVQVEFWHFKSESKASRFHNSSPSHTCITCIIYCNLIFKIGRFLCSSLSWIQQRIGYKIISLTYTALQFGQPTYLRQLLNIQPNRPTRSGSLVTLARPTTPRLKISDRSFHIKAPALWNSLPAHLRQPASPQSGSGLLALSRDQFLAQLKTHLFHQTYPP